MSKHKATRRHTYGRRQHEVQQRQDRRLDRGPRDWADQLDSVEIDPLAFLDPRALRARYGFSD